MSATLHTLPPDGKLRAVEAPTADEIRSLMPAALLAQIRNPPPAVAWCARCKRTTPTAILKLRSGLVSNSCGVCRACRQGRPYLGRWDSQPQHHDAGETGQGVDHEANAQT